MAVLIPLVIADAVADCEQGSRRTRSLAFGINQAATRLPFPTDNWLRPSTTRARWMRRP